MLTADNTRDDLFGILETMQASEGSDGISQALYNDLIKVLAFAAVKSEIDESKFFKDVDEIVPYVYGQELRDDDFGGWRKVEAFLHLTTKVVQLIVCVWAAHGNEILALADEIKIKFLEKPTTM